MGVSYRYSAWNARLARNLLLEARDAYLQRNYTYATHFLLCTPYSVTHFLVYTPCSVTHFVLHALLCHSLPVLHALLSHSRTSSFVRFTLSSTFSISLHTSSHTASCCCPSFACPFYSLCFSFNRVCRWSSLLVTSITSRRYTSLPSYSHCNCSSRPAKLHSICFCCSRH